MKKGKLQKLFRSIKFSHVCVVITVAFGSLLLAFSVACVLRLLPVSRVEIIDAPYDRFDMMEIIAIREGKDRWWDVDTTAIEERLIDERQFIKEVKVTKKFPNKIEVRVEESRNARWYVDISGIKYALDSDLYVIEEIKKTDGITKLELPELTGAYERKTPTFGQSETEVKKTLEIIDTVRSSGLRTRITELNVSDRTDIKMVIDGKYRVELGGATDLAGKLIKIEGALNQPEVKNSDGGTLIIYDLSSGVAFREN